jgi:hypothetical protein
MIASMITARDPAAGLPVGHLLDHPVETEAA